MELLLELKFPSFPVEIGFFREVRIQEPLKKEGWKEGNIQPRPRRGQDQLIQPLDLVRALPERSLAQCALRLTLYVVGFLLRHLQRRPQSDRDGFETGLWLKNARTRVAPIDSRCVEHPPMMCSNSTMSRDQSGKGPSKATDVRWRPSHAVACALLRLDQV